MKDIRSAIRENEFPDFVKKFLSDNYSCGTETYPTWATDALKSVGIIT